MQEQLDGLVRLLVEQVVQAPEIGARQAADLAVTVTLPAAPTDYPAGQRRQGNEQEEPEPLGDEIHLRSASIKRLGGGNRGHGRGDRLVGTAQLGVERNDHAHQHQARTDDDADQQRSDDRHADRGLELGEHQVDGHLVHVHGTDDQPEKQHRQQDQQTKNLHATAPVAGGRRIGVQRQHTADPLAQLLARLEMGNMLARQGNRFAGLRVATQARRTIVQREAAKTTDFDAIPGGQRTAHHFQQRLHRQIDIIGLQVRLAARKDFDQFGFGHHRLTSRASQPETARANPRAVQETTYSVRPITRTCCRSAVHAAARPAGWCRWKPKRTGIPPALRAFPRRPWP
ncbi:hypothetical protein G6F65_016609 [Rhizopus arrhizus]|nr:hypothetical protein G6F65_016609 [Rhizopus arrhizus]